jgi:hypothetical protein
MVKSRFAKNRIGMYNNRIGKVISCSDADCRVIFENTPKKASVVVFKDKSIAFVSDIQDHICKLIKIDFPFIGNIFVKAKVTIYPQASRSREFIVTVEEI